MTLSNDDAGLEVGASAFEYWRDFSRGDRAAALEAIAAALDARREQIIQTACEETALTAEEFAPEFLRMVSTFRMFAGILREGSWVRAAVDRPRREPEGAIGPNHDARRMLVPLGVAAVFGASNFPLSYGVCGGDTASALAAGCSVVVKEHPAHPKTGRLLSGIVVGALSQCGCPENVMGYVRNEDPTDLSVARALVTHPRVKAVGFTGSIKAGMALHDLARSRPDPIPVFAEMGSTNPVFVLPGAMERDAVGIADRIADAVLVRNGQQCTKPGLVFFEGSQRSPEFMRRLQERFAAARSRRMLAPWITDAFLNRSDEIAQTGASLEASSDASPLASDDSRRFCQARLWSVDFDQWLSNPSLQEEAFGPSTIWVLMDTWKDHERVKLHGHLTVTLLVDEKNPADLARARDFMVSDLAMAAGRVIVNGVPTGVRVAHGMVHSGPYPACNRPDTTAVGPFAIERWCRPVCFQNAPQELLPEELRDGNPLGIGRFEDGVWVAGRGPQGSGG